MKNEWQKPLAEAIVPVDGGDWNWFENPEYCRSGLFEIFFIDRLKVKLRLPKDLSLLADTVHAPKSPGDLDR